MNHKGKNRNKLIETNKMKKLKNIYLLLIAVLLMTACSENKLDDIVPQPEKKEGKLTNVEGIEKAYSLKQGAILQIKPNVKFDSEQKQQLTYEWNINHEKVSNDETLHYTCSKLGEFPCFLKVTAADGTAKIIEFKLFVYSDYNRGLLLFTEGEQGAELAYKALDIQNIPMATNVFKQSNPNLMLGTTPLALCWTGEGITNPNNINDFEGLNVVVSTDNPRKVYLLDPNTLEVKTEIVYDGKGEFYPNFAFAPFGGQNFRWNKDFNVIYFIGNGRDYMMTLDHHFLEGRANHQLPKGVRIADLACSIIPLPTDMVRIHFDLNSKRLLYVAGLGGTALGNLVCDVTPMALLPCDGVYANELADHRYEPRHFLFVGYTSTGEVNIYRLSPKALKGEETVLTNIQSKGNIKSSDAIGVNPTKPIMYYGNENGKIFAFNYEATNFSNKPYIDLGDDFAIKQIIFNPYNSNEMYVAAENKKAPAHACASVFIINATNKEGGKVVEADHHVGGKIRRMVFKGNGQENLDRK